MNDATTIIIVEESEDIDAECSELARKIAPLVLQDLQLGIPAEDTPHGRALTAAVYRAVDALEGQGARSMRIARQLLEALARYECALGQLLIADDDPPLSYRVEWCIWVDGFGADQQDWQSSEHLFTDEYEANTMRERCDERFRTINIRHRVVQVIP